MKAIFSFLLLVAPITFLSAQTASYQFYNVNSGTGNGIRFWGNDQYKIHMGNTSNYKYGPVTDYSIKFNMSTNAGRGWTWGVSGQQPVAALGNTGNFQIAGQFVAMGKIGVGTASPMSALDLFGGNVTLNDNDIQFRWFGNHSNKLGYREEFDGESIDGPVLKGALGGVLATNDGTDKIVLHWDHNGRVGINKANALTELDVNGRVFLRNESTESARSVTSSVYNQSENSGTLLELANGDMMIGGGLSDNKFIFHMQYWSANANELFIAPVTGGTHEWDKALTLDTDGSLTKKLNLGTDVAFQTYSSETGNTGNFFKVYGNGNVEAKTVRSIMEASGDAIVVENSASNGIDFLVKGDGRVYAREVEVTINAFPDYVFDDGYELMELSLLRNYIEAKNHLPGVKSAEEVEEEGIGLGELSKIQMEKIEELTLYILELEARIQKLESK